MDPDPTAREDLRVALDRWNCDLRAYSSAEAFLPELNGMRTGCLVVEFRLPGMDGAALLKRLQSLDRLLPTIVLTGRGNVRDAVEAMRAGAVACVEKPFGQQALLRQIRRCLDLHS